jgi:tetratricopeptide (TPR) repeat protein
MSYTKYLLLVILFMAGCSSVKTQDATPATPTDGKVAAAAPSAAELEIELYTQALRYISQNQLDEAESALRGITEKRPELAGPWANLGLIKIKQNQFDKAEEHLNKALQRNPKLAQAYNLLGFIESKRTHISKAKDLYEKAIANKDDYALAHYNVALIYDIYLRDIPKAVEHYKRYLELTNFEDKRTADWLKELSNILSKG